jgi:predicted dehydrogenase
MVGYCKRFAPTYSKALDLLHAGAIGDVRSFTATSAVAQVFAPGTGWRYSHASGGGALAVIGCHLLDLLRWYFGEVTSCRGVATALHSLHVEDDYQGHLEMASGVEGEFDVSWSRPGHRVLETSITVTGTTGTLTVTDDVIRISGSAPALIYKQHLVRPLPIDLGGPEYCAETEAFLQAIQAGTPQPLPVEEGYRTQALIDRLQACAPLQRSPAS